MEGMCFPQCRGQLPRSALCPFPLGCKLRHTCKAPEGSCRSPCTRKGLPSPKWGSLGSWLVPGTWWHEAEGPPVISGVLLCALIARK